MADVVREMIVGSGLATDRPESNFVMAGYDRGEDFNENTLAGRAVRAFLGQRIDCAQCHDHPFANWKQHQSAGDVPAVAWQLLGLWYGAIRPHCG